MNSGFFTLPQEKQQAVINAGFKIFALYPYNKAPMSEIAGAAGISKSLLFYHFKNKKELYIFLWQKSVELIRCALQEQGVLETDDYFEMLRRSLRGKSRLMKSYPYASEFSMRAYFEGEREFSEDIRHSFLKLEADSWNKVWQRIDKSKLRDDIDPLLMYREMVWASDGFMHQMVNSRNMEFDRIEKEFEKLIDMWEKVYQKAGV